MDGKNKKPLKPWENPKGSSMDVWLVRLVLKQLEPETHGSCVRHTETTEYRVDLDLWSKHLWTCGKHHRYHLERLPSLQNKCLKNPTSTGRKRAPELGTGSTWLINKCNARIGFASQTFHRHWKLPSAKSIAIPPQFWDWKYICRPWSRLQLYTARMTCTLKLFVTPHLGRDIVDWRCEDIEMSPKGFQNVPHIALHVIHSRYECILHATYYMHSYLHRTRTRAFVQKGRDQTCTINEWYVRSLWNTKIQWDQAKQTHFYSMKQVDDLIASSWSLPSGSSQQCNELGISSCGPSAYLSTPDLGLDLPFQS